MPPELKPAYLICGGDEAKTESALGRLRARAEEEGGTGALEVFAADGNKAPDIEGAIGSIHALSLTSGRRIILVDGVEKAKKDGLAQLAAAVADPVPETTVVLAARGPGPKELSKAVEKAGGQILLYEAPDDRSLPAWLVERAAERGLGLEMDAARLLVERLGTSQLRLANELDRLVLWAGEVGRVDRSDLEEMVADTSETATYRFADAVVEGNAEVALALGDRLLSEGTRLTGLVWQLANRLRDAQHAASELAAGKPAGEVQKGMRMPPWAARKLVGTLRDTDPQALRNALIAVADLEGWSRGDADYDDATALVLATARATTR
ncbi:MAG: DNA polymerase III subunit delta [Solirubrobacterales bacterium]